MRCAMFLAAIAPFFLFLFGEGGDRLYMSSAVAEMGDRGRNRHGSKRGGGATVPLSRGSWVPY